MDMIFKNIVPNLQLQKTSCLEFSCTLRNNTYIYICKSYKWEPLDWIVFRPFLLISLMRHLTSRSQLGKGLFNAFSDPRIAKSLVAMHTKPGHAWTLDGLAQLAGMSRTSFANNFKDAMQVSPGKYLENLRLAIARQMTQSGIGLKQVATKTGYASPSTLSRALNRLN